MKFVTIGSWAVAGRSLRDWFWQVPDLSFSLKKIKQGRHRATQVCAGSSLTVRQHRRSQNVRVRSRHEFSQSSSSKSWSRPRFGAGHSDNSVLCGRHSAGGQVNMLEIPTLVPVASIERIYCALPLWTLENVFLHNMNSLNGLCAYMKRKPPPIASDIPVPWPLWHNVDANYNLNSNSGPKSKPKKFFGTTKWNIFTQAKEAYLEIASFTLHSRGHANSVCVLCHIKKASSDRFTAPFLLYSAAVSGQVFIGDKIVSVDGYKVHGLALSEVNTCVSVSQPDNACFFLPWL
jgi:hypothetical protein